VAPERNVQPLRIADLGEDVRDDGTPALALASLAGAIAIALIEGILLGEDLSETCPNHRFRLMHAKARRLLGVCRGDGRTRLDERADRVEDDGSNRLAAQSRKRRMSRNNTKTISVTMNRKPA